MLIASTTSKLSSRPGGTGNWRSPIKSVFRGLARPALLAAIATVTCAAFGPAASWADSSPGSAAAASAPASSAPA
ncbi:MAG TPA: hypothetical protein VMB48_09665, partial [Steroidobacteraceae bacterium]|nr:hypothetical protein [Steroidobacteraceae bacterium]